MAVRRRGDAASAATRDQPPALVALVSRLVLVQSGVAAALGLAYLRRNITWLLFALMLAVALCCLAGLVRSGTHAAWVIAVVGESGYVVLGLMRVMSVTYLGGTLLAIITLGVLLHPAVGRAFTAVPRRLLAAAGAVRIGEQTLAENADGAMGTGA